MSQKYFIMPRVHVNATTHKYKTKRQHYHGPTKLKLASHAGRLVQGTGSLRIGNERPADALYILLMPRTAWEACM
jgi:hypothetical protein